MLGMDETGELKDGLEDDVFLERAFEKVADVKIGERYFRRATVDLSLNEVDLYDDSFIPALGKTSSVAYLATEGVKLCDRDLLTGEPGEPLFEVSL